MAMAIPRIAPPDGGGVPLPQPLPPNEAAAIRRIFALQADGDIPAALRETARLDVGTPLSAAMLGHILAQRYLGPYTRPDANQLRDWLDRWPDLPDARSIHSLLVVRMPRGETAPPLPPGMTAIDDRSGPADAETADPDSLLRRQPALDRAVWNAARTHGQAAVERLLQRNSTIALPYAAQLRGEAARILFTLNQDQPAYDLASAAVTDGSMGPGAPCARAALAGYVAGLAAWRLQRFDDAQTMFEAAWRSDLTTADLQAGAAYWAARGYLRNDDIAGAVKWLRRAAERRRTFYGLLARRALAMTVDASRAGSDERQTLGVADVEAVAATPQGLRAFALLQVDQPDRAAAELRGLWPAAKRSAALARAVMLVADEAGLGELAGQFADLLAGADDDPADSDAAPLPRLLPANGFTVDPAIVYGLARTESNFDSGLVSSAGARGLLQIMPETAMAIVGHRISDDLNALLHDPAVNLDLGQRYLAWLAKQDVVNGNLIRLLAAYNAGPGNFARWSTQIRDDGDPLLFIEAIPVDETRAHVPRVLAYTWMYAARLHRPMRSLNDLAAGRWPRYLPFDDPRMAETHTVALRVH